MKRKPNTLRRVLRSIVFLCLLAGGATWFYMQTRYPQVANAELLARCPWGLYAPYYVAAWVAATDYLFGDDVEEAA